MRHSALFHHVTVTLMPPKVTTYLMGILREMYMPGVSDEGARDAQCYEVRLSGSPWSHNSSYNLGWLWRSCGYFRALYQCPQSTLNALK